jgi:hypothetical protein
VRRPIGEFIAPMVPCDPAPWPDSSMN